MSEENIVEENGEWVLALVMLAGIALGFALGFVFSALVFDLGNSIEDAKCYDSTVRVLHESRDGERTWYDTGAPCKGK
jgi:hypothetical protein